MTFPIPDWSAALRRKAGTPAFAAARERAGRSRRRIPRVPAAAPVSPGRVLPRLFLPGARGAAGLRSRTSGKRHTCPIDGTPFQGEPFDSAWLWSVNDMLSDAALRLALRSVSPRQNRWPTPRARPTMLTGYARATASCRARIEIASRPIPASSPSRRWTSRSGSSGSHGPTRCSAAECRRRTTMA